MRTGHLSAERWKLVGLACVGGLAAFSVLSSVVEENAGPDLRPAQAAEQAVARKQAGGVAIWKWSGGPNTAAPGAPPAPPFATNNPAPPNKAATQSAPDQASAPAALDKPRAPDIQHGPTVPAMPRVLVKPSVVPFSANSPDPGKGA